MFAGARSYGALNVYLFDGEAISGVSGIVGSLYSAEQLADPRARLICVVQGNGHWASIYLHGLGVYDLRFREYSGTGTAKRSSDAAQLCYGQML